MTLEPLYKCSVSSSPTKHVDNRPNVYSLYKCSLPPLENAKTKLSIRRWTLKYEHDRYASVRTREDKLSAKLRKIQTRPSTKNTRGSWYNEYDRTNILLGRYDRRRIDK